MIDVNRSPVTVITLYSALWPLSLAVLPVGQIIGVPRSLSASDSPSGDDARLCDIFVSWVPGTEADASGWRPRVDFALDHARDVATLVTWLEDGCNGLTLDLSVEILAPEDLDPRTLGTRPVPLATWLDGLAWATLGEHCALQAEVELLSGMATAG